MKILKTTLPLFVAIIFLVHGSAFAQINPPEKIAYQVVVRNSAGVILENQDVTLRFTIHSGTPTGISEYSETQSLTTNQFGLVTAKIGSGTVALGTWNSITWSGDKKFLQVEIDINGGTAFTEMGTSEMVSVPYAYHSKTAATSLDNHWNASGYDIYSANLGKVGIGTVTPGSRLTVNDSSTQSLSGILQVVNTSTAGVDAVAVYGISKPKDYYGIGGLFEAGYKGVVGRVQPTGSNSYYGIYGDVYGGTGINYGVYGTSDKIGTYGYSEGSGGSLTTFTYLSTNDNETAGVFGKSVSTSGLNSSKAFGVVGQSLGSSSDINCGVYGEAMNAGYDASSVNYGVVGKAFEGPNSVGVHGNTGGFDASGIYKAVEALSYGFGTNYGVYADVPFNDYAGYFSGILYANSSTSGVKAFKIDHPQDPANKFLYHSSVESNEMVNIYRGNITTDAGGFAKIDLPSWFETLNKDFSYQLTCIGTFAQAMVNEKIKDNSFSIKTDKPNVEVSWLVSGVRHDPVAEMFRIVPEVEKKETEKGKYLIPAAYGQDSSKAMVLPSTYYLPDKKQNIK